MTRFSVASVHAVLESYGADRVGQHPPRALLGGLITTTTHPSFVKRCRFLNAFVTFAR